MNNNLSPSNCCKNFPKHFKYMWTQPRTCNSFLCTKHGLKALASDARGTYNGGQGNERP